MKLNKIISAVAAVAMLSTSLVSVSAAGIDVSYNADMGINLVNSIPTEDEVKARDAKLDITVEKLADKAAIQAETNAMWANTAVNKAYDVYKVTAKFSNLGEVANGYNGDCSGERLALGLRAWELNIVNAEKSAKILSFSAKASQFADGGVKIAKDGTNLNCYYQATDAENPYPSYDMDAFGDANYIENAEASLVMVYAIEGGTTLTINEEDYASTFMYTVGKDAVYATLDKPASFTLGTVTPDPEPLEDFVIENKRDLDSGWAWDVTINNYDSAATYTATFTAGGETKTNKLFFADAEVAEGGSIAFATLLKTTKAAVELALSK